MYLTEKSKGKERDVDEHDEVELLLEAYVKQVDGIVQEADQLASNMRNTEEVVNIILDANRNSLMLLDLKVPPSQHTAWLIAGIDDDTGNRIRRHDSRITRHESDKFHRRLELGIPPNHYLGVRDKFSSLWIRTHQIETDSKVDSIRALSRNYNAAWDWIIGV